jgi:hypothetical protein
MNSYELAKRISRIALAHHVSPWTVRRASDRITGIGNEQYSLVGENGEPLQKFETYATGTLLWGLVEELLDVINYVGMISIKEPSNCPVDVREILVNVSNWIFDIDREILKRDAGVE